MNIQNALELAAHERRIGDVLRWHTLDSVLLGLRQAPPNTEPFMIAGTALFAVRYCVNGLKSVPKPLRWPELQPIVHEVTNHLLADPLSFNSVSGDVDKSLLSVMLRIVGSQSPYRRKNTRDPGRLLMLYEELPEELKKRSDIPKFDFAAKFKALNKVSVRDFITVCFTAFAGATAKAGMRRDYFEKARTDGANVPSDETVMLVLDQIAAEPSKLKEIYERYKQPDRQFAAYDYNPLFVYPIIRPWKQNHPIPMAEDYLTAPVPDLVAWRMSTGIYYQMSDRYKADFTQYFGRLFEEYVGCVLKHCVPSSCLLSEKDIRKAYTFRDGKAPDWIVIDGSQALLIECKATRFNQKALATGSQDEIKKSVSDIQSGLEQLYEFREACKGGRVRLDALKNCKTFLPVIVTSEEFYLANSHPFDGLLYDGMEPRLNEMPMTILSIEQLELLQAYVSAGFGIGNILSRLEHENLGAVFTEIEGQVASLYEHSFYYEKNNEFYSFLDVPDN